MHLALHTKKEHAASSTTSVLGTYSTHYCQDNLNLMLVRCKQAIRIHVVTILGRGVGGGGWWCMVTSFTSGVRDHHAHVCKCAPSHLTHRRRRRRLCERMHMHTSFDAVFYGKHARFHVGFATRGGTKKTPCSPLCDAFANMRSTANFRESSAQRARQVSFLNYLPPPLTLPKDRNFLR